MSTKAMLVCIRQIRSRVELIFRGNEPDFTLSRLIDEMEEMITRPEAGRPEKFATLPILDIEDNIENIWQRLRTLEKSIEETRLYLSSVKPTMDAVNAAITSMRGACEVMDHLLDSRAPMEAPANGKE